MYVESMFRHFISYENQCIVKILLTFYYTLIKFAGVLLTYLYRFIHFMLRLKNKKWQKIATLLTCRSMNLDPFVYFHYLWYSFVATILMINLTKYTVSLIFNYALIGK